MLATATTSRPPCRRAHAGAVPRVPAPEIERLVIATLAQELAPSGSTEESPDSDRALVEQHLTG